MFKRKFLLSDIFSHKILTLKFNLLLLQGIQVSTMHAFCPGYVQILEPAGWRSCPDADAPWISKYECGCKWLSRPIMYSRASPRQAHLGSVSKSDHILPRPFHGCGSLLFSNVTDSLSAYFTVQDANIKIHFKYFGMYRDQWWGPGIMFWLVRP